MLNSITSTNFRIEIDGQAMSTDMTRSVLQWIVDDHLHLPDMFAIWLQETPDMDVAKQAKVSVGSRVTISAAGSNDPAPIPLITGEVTALEGEYRHAKPPVVIVRGYDQGHRLMRGRNSKLFRQMKYSDIVRQVAGDAGLDIGSIDDSGQVFEYVHQAGQTSWDFIREFAREIGYEVSMPDGKVTFRKPPPASGAPDAGDMHSSNALALVFGQQLEEFRPRVTAAGQVKKVSVRGWDPVTKQDLVGQAEAATSGVQLQDSAGSLAAKFGSPEMVSGHQRLGTQAEVDAAAHALSEHNSSAFAEATGVAVGNPMLRAGAAVSVSKVAAQFAGNYTLTHTRHTFEMRHGYRTHFEISGRQERSLLGLATGGTAAGGGGGGGGGTGGGGATSIQIGVVDDANDPTKLGRVRVRLPYLGADFVSGWARTIAPGNGADRGMVWIPEVGDEVLVAFEGGDIGFPVVLGGLWNGKDAPPPIEITGGAVQSRKLVSRTGQKIVFSDKDGSTGIKISSKDDAFFVHIDVDNKKVIVTSGNGGEVKVTADGDITIDAKGSVKISGQSGVEISSTGQTKVSGSGGLNLESSGITAVKGSQVSLG